MKKILSNILLVFAVIVFLLAVVFVFFGDKNEELYIFGYKPFIVATGSMEVQYMTHSLVVIQQGGYDEVQVDDAIAFRSEAIGQQLAFHRVISISDEGFITKGDNNPNTDGLLVTRDSFIGHEVFHTNWTAYYMQALNGPYGILRMVVLPILALIMLFVGMYFFSRWKADKWLKRFIIAGTLLFISVVSLVVYTVWTISA